MGEGSTPHRPKPFYLLHPPDPSPNPSLSRIRQSSPSMAAATERFIHLSRPLAPQQAGLQTSNSPLTVNIQPQAILSVLDHATRRDARDASQPDRVTGALVGTRSEDGSEVEVRSCFAIPHTEEEDQVEVDVEYQKNMLALTLKANPREVLLGWYTTSLELNSLAPLSKISSPAPTQGRS